MVDLGCSELHRQGHHICFWSEEAQLPSSLLLPPLPFEDSHGQRGDDDDDDDKEAKRSANGQSAMMLQSHDPVKQWVVAVRML